MARQRADELLVTRELVATRDEAAQLIRAGRVRQGTRILVQPGTLLPLDAPLTLDATQAYVSRGGLKLEGALRTWPIDVAGRACIDLGSSTGGFTDCLLQHGAASVIAVDVGKGLLHASLRNDARVRVLEGVNARELPLAGHEPDISFFCADLSFISLTSVLPGLGPRLNPGTEGVVLFKPQFEAPREEVPHDGIIRDDEVRERALAVFAGWAAAEGWRIRGRTQSPITGAKGNVEYLLWLTTPPDGIA